MQVNSCIPGIQVVQQVLVLLYLQQVPVTGNIPNNQYRDVLCIQL